MEWGWLLFVSLFILLLNFLIKLAIVFIDMTFIGLVGPQSNSVHLKITRLILPFIWAVMQSWLLDHLATSLDLSTISGLRTIKRDCHPIKDQLKSFNIDVPREGLIPSSQLSFYNFTYGFANGMTSISFFFTLIY